MRLVRILFGVVVVVLSTIVVILIVAALVAGLIGAALGAALIALVALLVFGVALALDALRSTPPACALVTRVAFRDTCEGVCAVGQICTTTATRPYGPGFLGLAPQAAACACLAPGVPGGAPGAPGGGAPGEDG
jgi:hypothetical protein